VDRQLLLHLLTHETKSPTMQEEWRAVVGFEGRYEVSNLGRVKSLKRKVAIRHGKTRTVRERIVAVCFRGYGGYPRLTLSKPNDLGGAVNSVSTTVHTLVLTAFVGPRPPGAQCRHLDGNPTNSKLGNLCWGTVKENAADRVRHASSAGSRNPKSKLREPEIARIRNTPASVTELAKLFGVAKSTISRARRGLAWQCVA
jgi:hypothetical protein